MKLYVAQILIPRNISKTYSYLYNEQLSRGAIVLVNFHNKDTIGVVISCTHHDEHSHTNIKLKYILDILYKEGLSNQLIETIDWFSGYYLAPKGMALRVAMGSKIDFFKSKKQEVEFLLNLSIDSSALTSAQSLAYNNLLKSNDSYFVTKSDIAKQSCSSSSIVNNLIKKAALTERPASYKTIKKHQLNLVELSKDQSDIVHKISNKSGYFSVNVIDGETGSGKSEVYFHLIKEHLFNGKSQVLFMVPEVALLQQLSSRFKKAFGIEPYIWHHGISDSQKRSLYSAIINNHPTVVLGTRSSVLLPFNNLSLIIIDEEHDGSYKQDNMPMYHGRDVAIFRALKEKCPIILGSATMSSETYNNVQNNRYEVFKLSNRFGNMPTADIKVVEEVNFQEGSGYVGEEIITGIKEALQRKDQAMVFLNRRGHSSSLLCSKCGYLYKCHNCSAFMSYHDYKKYMLCHYCGHSSTLPQSCHSCGSSGSLLMRGCGVEKIAQEIEGHFPDSKIFIASSDTLNSEGQIVEFMRAVDEQEIDIIIGTQIISKGYDFKRLTFAGVISGYLNVVDVDLKSTENLWQSIYQVTGRIGRHKMGYAVIQTPYVKSILIDSIKNKDRQKFLSYELEMRRRAAMPPFATLAGIILECKDEGVVQSAAKEMLGNWNKSVKDCSIFGPIDAPIYLLRGKYRKRFLIKAISQDRYYIQKIVHNWLLRVRLPKSVNIKVDINPISMY